MKRILFVGILAALLLTVVAVTAFAAPGGPGWGMMGRLQGGPDGYGHMNGYGMMGRPQGEPGGYGSMMGDELEELLGIDHAAIHAAHVSGKSLVELAAEKGVTEGKLIETVLTGRKAALQQAVEAGKLTQASADQMLRFMETNIKTMVEAKDMSGMMGRGVPGDMMGGARGVPDGTRSGSCHGSQAPAQQGAEI